MDDLDDVILPKMPAGADAAEYDAAAGGDAASTDSSSDSDSSSSGSDSGSDSDSDDDNQGAIAEPKNYTLKFRNYRPFDAQLKKSVIPPASAAADLAWLNDEVNAIVARAKQSDDALLSIAPRPADWDLARDAEPRLAILSARTKRALAIAVRNKINTAQAGAGAGAGTRA